MWKVNRESSLKSVGKKYSINKNLREEGEPNENCIIIANKKSTFILID